MLSFGTVWKLNPGFWSSWLTWRQEQHNEGWESGGKGAQKYGRRENVVGETGDSDPLSHPPPPPPTKNPGWLTWRREQHNEGRESGGKGTQKYGRRENVVGETGDSDPPVPSSPPPPNTQKFAPIKNFLVRCLVRCKGCSLVGWVLLRGCVNTAQILHVFLQPGWSEKYLVRLAEAFFIG